jgi:DME family drug/metabolite transporter
MQNYSKGISLVILASLFWATSSILINLIVQGSGISAVSLAFWRDLTTSILLIILVLIFRPSLFHVSRENLPWLIAMGVISIGLFHVLWNTSVVLFGASIATVIQSNAPIFVTIIARFVFSEPINLRKIAAVAFSVLGTILSSGIISTGIGQISTIGLLAALGSAIAYGTFPLFGRRLAGDTNSWTIMLYAFIFGTLTLLPFQLGKPLPLPISPQVIMYFVCFVIVSTIGGFGVFSMSLKYLPASIASITATAEIVFASIMAYFILGERLDAWQWVGAALVISGVILVSLPSGKNVPTTGETYS